jgi:hypothetical protein
MPANFKEPYCILAMDGATPEGGGFITAGLLHDIARRLSRRRPFLDHLVRERRDDERLVFAGTSSGGWSALYLAAQKYPDAVLRTPADAWDSDDDAPDREPSVLKYWKDLTDAMSPMNSSLPRLAGAAAGACAVSSSNTLREFFIDIFGADTRLGDLPHKVFITSFQLDNQAPRRRWAPKFFCNFGDDRTDDERVVDVALRTSSAPVWLPVFQSIEAKGPGYLDGGVFANNPALCVLAEVVAEIKREADAATREVGQLLRQIRAAIRKSKDIDARVKRLAESALLQRTLPRLLPMILKLHNVRLLSLGNGVSSTFVDIEREAEDHDGVADWGYARWLLDWQRPALLIHLIWKAGEEAVDEQCAEILGPQLYRRLQPFLPHSFEAFIGAEAVRAVRRMWTMDWTEGEIHDVVDWLEKSGWCPARRTNRGRAGARRAK